MTSTQRPDPRDRRPAGAHAHAPVPRARPVARALAALCGVLLVGAAAAQALAGWPALARPLLAAGVGLEALAPIAAGWYFGTACILGFAALAFAAAVRADGRLAVRHLLAILAFVWIGFGSAAMYARDGNPHYLYFIGIGGLLALAAALAPRP